ncbi:MAG: 4'-phosphopantetheinyl transferase superfamily protein [bacterium]|nr:4'-phosphopantetheinyl transferase superfamily protein [bacterium]MCY4271782.1 4'-phosphopantetheinyl transferase superfamily protein [bacterium]
MTGKAVDARGGVWWRLYREVESVEIYHVDLSPGSGREEAPLAWLDASELDRWHRVGNPAPRRRFALCRAALRAVLCGRVGCANESLAFGFAEQGKPFAVVDGCAHPVSFNVSHSGSHGLIAVTSAGRLGVDAEERVPRRNLEALIDGVCSPREKAELESRGDPERLHLFLRFWTVKEAVVKAEGRGLAMRAAELEVPEEMRRGAPSTVARFSQTPERSWCLEDIGAEDFAAAVAHEANPQPSLEIVNPAAG